ncbi:insecticidal delta-endotoxin Cry8Ea1 family protein, partial [Bacillus toyonensis]
MNINDNKNEYEILDSGNLSYQPRYPLARAPGSECQKPNAKDGIYTPVGRVDTALQNIDIGLSIRTALSILQMLLSVSFPALGRAAGLINIIFGFLWGTLAGQSVWEKFMRAVESLVNQKITDAVRVKALSELEGVQNALELYQEAADDWNENPTDASNKERVRRQFTSTNTTIEYAMPSFRVPTFEVPLLTVYAQAANLHLQLLRDAVKFGNEWGMPSEEVEDMYNRLTRRTAEYTDHCVATYDKGLKEAYDLAPNPTDYNKYPYLNPYSKDPIYGKYYTAPVDWNLFNDYRRDMTLMVLDIVAVWPTYNPRIYTNPNGVQVELSREVYSTVYGRGGSNNSSFDAIESQIVRPPHLVTELTNLKIEQGATLDMEQIQYPKYMKVTNTLHYVGSSSTWEQSSSAIPIRPITQIHTIPANNIGNLSLSQLDVPYRFSFYNKDDALIAAVGAEFPPNTVTWNGIPKAEDSNQNSHHLSYVGALGTQSSAGFPWTYPTELLGEWGFGWLHNSLTPTNEILSDKITQIPAVKGYLLERGAKVVKGPGSTGGDLIQLPGASQGRITINISNAFQKSFMVRIRYAATADGQLKFGRISSDGGIHSTSTKYVTTGANENVNSLTYNRFKYTDVYGAMASNIYSGIVLINEMGGSIYIDKIEFIPIKGSLEVFEAEQDLENARKAVNALFTGAAKDVLKLNVTDYAVDQASNLVECVSDEFHAQEKMILLDQVKFAKRLSQARNLLNYGDFESSDWSGENGWRTSHHVSVRSDNPTFKGHYLHMPGAMSPQFSHNIYPTYAYQKVDESKLKSYTRYLVRGFVGNSKDLELLVERYGKDVHVEMDVPNDIRYTLPMNECGGFDRCKPASHQTGSPHTYTCKDTAVAHTDCQCKDKENRTSTNMYTNVPTDSAVYMNGSHTHQSCGCKNKNSDRYQSGTHPQKSCGCKDPHVFSYHIDTGCVDQEENLGLWFALKIASENGVANIDNLEIIEAQPLTGEALARVKKREQKWKQEMAQKRLQTDKAVQAAQTAMQALFTNAQYNRLKFETLFPQIVNAEMLIQQIPYM